MTRLDLKEFEERVRKEIVAITGVDTSSFATGNMTATEVQVRNRVYWEMAAGNRESRIGLALLAAAMGDEGAREALKQIGAP